MKQCAASANRDSAYSECIEWANVAWHLAHAKHPNPQVTYWPPDLKFGQDYPELDYLREWERKRSKQ